MSPLFRRPSDHDRARELAALRIDGPLEAPDATWLDVHLAACEDCAAVADAYDADRLLFGSLRQMQPMPPRDLWARTAAAIDAGSGPRGARVSRRHGVLGIPAAAFAPLAGLAVVAIVVGAGLLNGSPVVPQPGVASGPLPTPIAVPAGDVAVLSRGPDGNYQLRTGNVDEVCPIAAETCDASPSFEATQVARIGDSDSVGAIISPARDHLVVVQRDAKGADGVYAVPVRPAGGDTSSASPSPMPTGTTATPVPTTSPTTGPASPSPAPPTASPAITPPVVPTVAPTKEPASVEPTGTPAVTAEPTTQPTTEPSTEPTTQPTTEPSTEPTTEPSTEPTTEPSTEPTTEPSPVPTVDVTPGPDDAIQIASDVVVVGGVAAYRADGSRFAFTARPSDGSAGPDVYVWNTGDKQARAVTTDHRSIFAGWSRSDILVSRVVDGAPRTFAINTQTGEERDAHRHDVWLPALAPDGERAAWWDGAVTLAPDGVTWVTGDGRLVIGDWSDAAAGDPGVPGDEQVLAKGPLRAWDVRWDAAGSVVGIWIADEPGKGPGHLSLYPVDPETGHARLDAAIVQDVPAFAGFSLESGRLVYPGPGTKDERSLWVVAWDGTDVGRVELSGEGGATVIR